MSIKLALGLRLKLTNSGLSDRFGVYEPHGLFSDGVKEQRRVQEYEYLMSRIGIYPTYKLDCLELAKL